MKELIEVKNEKKGGVLKHEGENDCNLVNK